MLSQNIPSLSGYKPVKAARIRQEVELMIRIVLTALFEKKIVTFIKN